MKLILEQNSSLPRNFSALNANTRDKFWGNRNCSCAKTRTKASNCRRQKTFLCRVFRWWCYWRRTSFDCNENKKFDWNIKISSAYDAIKKVPKLFQSCRASAAEWQQPPFEIVKWRWKIIDWRSNGSFRFSQERKKLLHGDELRLVKEMNHWVDDENLRVWGLKGVNW